MCDTFFRRNWLCLFWPKRKTKVALC
jgi:hypothetical protein